MATAVHDTTLQDITSSSTSSFQSKVAEPPLRSKSCGPDVGRESGGSAAKKDDTASSSTVPPVTDIKDTVGSVSESKSATAISSTKPKIFDNKIFVEAPIPKINPWLKPSATSVNNNKGENRDNMLFLATQY